MYLSLNHQFRFRPSSAILCSRKPPTTPPPPPPAARDLVIEFGKYKGKMLGTLPSNYLKWVSNNLRARDFEYWANLADQVLQDPVYKDRIEWEFADKILRGTNNKNNERADASLSEISERFGWDNDDKSGWRKVNFELLGTSNGGRIPRKASSSATNYENKIVREEIGRREEVIRVLSESERRRRERRMRLKKRERKGDKLEIMEKNSGVIENGADDDDKDRTAENYNSRFPGREALVNKVLKGKKFL